MSDVVMVLCVDDREDGETFDLQFQRDVDRRREDDGHEPRQLRRDGGVVVSERQARASLLRAMNQNLLPDVVLIDHLLRGDGRHKYETRGLDLMRWIRVELAKRALPVPACILWTADYHPLLAHTFVRCGGVQAIRRAIGWPDTIAAVWQGYDWHANRDGHWTHKPEPGHPAIVLPPAVLDLLAYLEVDTPNAAIALALGTPQKTLLQRRRTLVERINAQVPERLLPGGKQLALEGRSSSLAQIARDCGVAWVPLAYSKYLEDD